MNTRGGPVEIFTIIRYKTSGCTFARSTRGEEVEMDDEGMAIVHAFERFYEKKLADPVDKNTKWREELYHRGRVVWKRMRSTFDDLPDVPFRYCVGASGAYTDVMYVVFDGYTAIMRVTAEGGKETISISWETQDSIGWIGGPHVFTGRGSAVPEKDVPFAGALRAATPGGLERLFKKMMQDIQEDGWSVFGLAMGVPPAIDVAINELDDTILFDGVAVCKRGECPSVPLPKYFDAVRTDADYWRVLFNRALMHQHR